MSDSFVMPRVRPRLAALFAVVALVLPGVAAAETRVALIIANSHYVAFDKLSNPAADAKIVGDALQKTGFKVTVLEDLGLVAMNKALQQFGNEADHADIALVYYAGHGVEVDHVNYVVPVDVAFAHDRDVDIEAVKLDRMLSVTENAKRLRIVILDACRDNPFFDKLKKTAAQAGAVSKGMTAVEPTKNSLVVYSAKAGTLASDGRVNSPFAKALATRIQEEPGREISLMLRKVRDDVLYETDNRQEPFTYGSLSSEEFYFVKPPVIAAPVVAAPVVADIEAETWALCKTSINRGPCDAYLRSYGQAGRYINLVNIRLADITHIPAGGGTENARSVSIPTPSPAPMTALVPAPAPAPVVALAPAPVPAPVTALAYAPPPAAVAVPMTAVVSAPAPAPVVALAPKPTPAPVVVLAPAPTPAPVALATAAPVSAPLVAAAVVSAPTPAAAVIAAAPAPVPAPVVAVAAAPVPVPAPVVAVAPAPVPAAPVVVALATIPAPPPAAAPVALVPAPTPAPVVAAAPAPAHKAVAVLIPPALPKPMAPAIPVSERVGELGITVHFAPASQGIVIDSVDRNATFVAGKLFSGDLITKIDATAPDTAQGPNVQLASNWKNEGRLKLLVKRGDATLSVIIRSDN